MWGSAHSQLSLLWTSASAQVCSPARLAIASNGHLFGREDREGQAIGWQMMMERITHGSVTFQHAFVLRDVDGMQPPGTYRIETVEEPLTTLSFLAYRRVSTTITLPAVGVASLRKQIITIDPDELQAALAKDALSTRGDAEPRRT
jgi:hypothetical protein